MTYAAIVALLKTALLLLTLAQGPNVPKSLHDQVVSVANQAIAAATNALSTTPTASVNTSGGSSASNGNAQTATNPDRIGYANVNCAVLPSQTQTISCASGQTGSIAQVRTSSCTAGATTPVWGAWVTSSNTCSSVTASSATLCSAMTPLNNSSTDASLVLQSCIDSLQNGGTLELPPGKYNIAHQIHIVKPMTIRTLGKTQSSPACTLDDATCTQLVADAQFAQQWGVVTVGQGLPQNAGLQNLIFDHLIINGNNVARWNGLAGQRIALQDTSIGHNLMVFDCSNCQFTNNVFKNGVSAAAFGYGYSDVSGIYPVYHDHDTVIKNNLLAYNGAHDQSLHWSDGFTFWDGDKFTITDNQLIDNTDVDFILGGCTNCTIARNSITHTSTFSGSSFAAMNLQIWFSNFAGHIQGSTGDYSGTEISNNTIDCGANKRCGFGLYLGSKAWGYSPVSIKGGHIHDNVITNTEQAFNADTITGSIVDHNAISNSGGTFTTSIGSTDLGNCNIAPDASITFTANPMNASNCTSAVWSKGTPNWWTQDWKTAAPPAPAVSTPTGLTATCSADGTHATLAWSSVSGATSYLLRADDTTNQTSGCSAPKITGAYGVCVSPTDYVNDSATNPITISIPQDTAIGWWVHAVTPAGQSTPTIGQTFSCHSTVLVTQPTALSATCSSDSTHATFSWGPVPGVSQYAIRVNDTTNEAQGCASPSVTGLGGICVSPTDYVYDSATSPMTLSIPKGKALSWWVHAMLPTGPSAASIGTTLTCN